MTIEEKDRELESKEDSNNELKDIIKRLEKETEDLSIAKSFLEQKLMDNKKDVEARMENMNAIRDEER